jgi:hypothetical protein
MPSLAHRAGCRHGPGHGRRASRHRDRVTQTPRLGRRRPGPGAGACPGAGGPPGDPTWLSDSERGSESESVDHDRDSDSDSESA